MRKIILNIIIIVGLAAAPVLGQQSANLAEETTLIFVRHAEKSEDGTNDPSLSKQGAERAKRLAELLMESHTITAIYTTGYKRTKETSSSIADSLNLSVFEYQLNNPDSLMSVIIQKHRGEDVLIVGHSNTTPQLVNLSLGESKYEKLDETDYSNIFIVKLSGNDKATVKRLIY
ncbi:MAG: histidine phosphatase family protein [Gracilimonas sp.]|uniref:SixA phosphatase family protein n=1 Tax=Gracilimonas sp. TaxID=1974203 RepID=UPI0019B8CFB6|nr:phosphoglycerate mutase family protein [Gracilimonas sp.]MBD3615770.1 histidine phosphatase family protein [Gracilimonas sp.]